MKDNCVDSLRNIYVSNCLDCALCYHKIWIAHYATTNDYANVLTIPEQRFKILLYLSAGPRLQSMALFAEISGA